jgi:hypothetical protein
MNKDDNIIPFAFKRFQERRRSDGMDIKSPEDKPALDIDPVKQNFRRDTDPIEEIRTFTEARVMQERSLNKHLMEQLLTRPEPVSTKEHALYYSGIALGFAILFAFNIGMKF